MRKLSEDFPPFVGYLFVLLILLAFVGLSMSLFYRTTFAPYMYVLISLSLTSNLNEIKRNDFLKICFGNERYIKLRVFENLIIALPFVIFLIYEIYLQKDGEIIKKVLRENFCALEQEMKDFTIGNKIEKLALK